MNKILFLLFVVFLTYLPLGFAQGPTQRAPCEQKFIDISEIDCPPDEYILVWHDEFDGNALDFDKWYVGGKPNSPYNNAPLDRTIWQEGCQREHQIYLEDNVTVSGGMAHLTVKKEDYLYEGVTPDGYTSCENNDTDNKIVYEAGENFSELFHFTSGRIYGRQSYTSFNHVIMEMRCKIPKGKGLWPAFWTWNHDEIDVFEFFNTDDDDHFQTAYIKAGEKFCALDVCGSNFTQDFHTYKIEITPLFIKWYLDGSLVRSVAKYYRATGLPPPGGGTHYSGFFGCDTNGGIGWANTQNKLFPEDGRTIKPLINLAVNPKYDVDEISGFPGTMDVDYVRIYRRLPEEDVTNVCPYGIDGGNRICDDEVIEFQIQGNIPNSSDIIWSTSDNLIILEDNYDHIKVKQNENSIQNDGWVKAEFPDIEEYCSNFTKYIQTNNSPARFDIVEVRPTCLIDYGHYRVSPRSNNVTWSATGTPVSLSPLHGAYTYVETFIEGTFSLKATINHSCGDVVTITKDFYAGREQCSSDLIMKLTPNPSDDIITLKLDDSSADISNSRIVITNHNFEIKFQQIISDSEFQIDVSNYENGVYFLNVFNGEEKETTQFIVNHDW